MVRDGDSEFRSGGSGSRRPLLSPEIVVDEDKDQNADDYEEESNQTSSVVKEGSNVNKPTMKQ